MSPLVIALLAETAALVVALYFLTFRPNRPAEAPAPARAIDPTPKVDGESELARRTRELNEARSQLGDLREQVKKLKRERYDQKQADRGGQVLIREREHVEREASQHLEAVRSELAGALAETTRLKAELELHREKKGPPPSPVLAPSPVAHEKPVETPVSRPPRELNPSEVARIERLEQRSAKDRARALDLERDLKRFRAKSDMHSRLYLVVKGELDLSRDKYKALEKRLNRTLLEKDMLARAIAQLERLSGRVAERAVPTAEELAAADARTEAAQQAEAAALAEAQPPEERPKLDA